MWHLDPISTALKSWYKNKMIGGLASRVWSKLALANHLMPGGQTDTSTLERLLIDEPVDLFALNNQLMSLLIPGYNDAELEDYQKALNKKKNRSAIEQQLVDKYKSTLELIIETFDYQGQISGSKSRSYYLTKEIGHNTCVYCNRQYAFNIEKDGVKNDDSRFARPALDHWFPKSVYPLLSLSIHNLIPSCTVCNSSAKGDTIFRLSTHVNPYTTVSNNPGWHFDYKPAIGGGWEVLLKDFANAQEEETAKAFFLKEAYQAHAGLELNDTLELALQNGGSYVPTLIKHVMSNVNGASVEDAYRLLFGTEYDLGNQDSRPFSKLKRDILDVLKIKI